MEAELKAVEEVEQEPVKMYKLPGDSDSVAEADPGMRSKVSAATLLVTALWLQG